MARLPQPGSDNGTWGEILNEYLSVSLNGDGTIKPDVISGTTIQANSITQAKLSASTATSGQVLSTNGVELTWRTPENIAGPAGANGSDGAPGPVGPAGADGAPGAAGSFPSATAGQTLVADSTSTYTSVTPPWGGGDYMQSGYYSLGMDIPEATVGSINADTIFVRPYFVPARRTFDQIGIHASTAATDGGVVRMGIYAPGQGVPGPLILDAGTVDTTSAGPKEIVIDLTLDAGLYWIAWNAEVAPFNTPLATWTTFQRWTSSSMPFTTTPLTSSYMMSWTGAFPTSFQAYMGDNGSTALIALRAA